MICPNCHFEMTGNRLPRCACPPAEPKPVPPAMLEGKVFGSLKWYPTSVANSGAPSIESVSLDRLAETCRAFAAQRHKYDRDLRRNLGELVLNSRQPVEIWASRFGMTTAELWEALDCRGPITARFWEKLARAMEYLCAANAKESLEQEHNARRMIEPGSAFHRTFSDEFLRRAGEALNSAMNSVCVQSALTREPEADEPLLVETPKEPT